ncbi:MAG: HIT domain-containing protein [Candidatus Omnitrophica bacterium]|nr:HIT domain-containing protein [Candidatus Omnitrophota bacterium]
MSELWAPWRINYVQDKKAKGCVFCKILKAKNDTQDNVLLRSKHCFAVLNKFPYNNGHTLIVTNRHIKSLEQLKDQELLNINKTLISVKSRLKKILKPDGFNIGINIEKSAGAGIVGHIHIHLVPRWTGDTNFMPVTASTKIISQSLKELSRQFKNK